MTKSGSDKYTDPELRDKIKEEIQASDKGGEPGQWSARKAQMMAKEYKARGGGYKDDKKDEKAQHLEKWTEEEWQTKDGDANARSDEGTHRYLPKKAWDKMTDKEKEETEKQKLEGSKAGDQYVPNTDKAKRSRKQVSDGEDEEEEEEEEGDDDQEAEGKEEDNDDADDSDGDDDDSAAKKGSKAKRSAAKAKSANEPKAKKARTESKKSKKEDSKKGADKEEEDEDEDDEEFADPDEEEEEEDEEEVSEEDEDEVDPEDDDAEFVPGKDE